MVMSQLCDFCIAFIFNISHEDLIILDFSDKSLFWLILSVKENVPNNSAHLNISFSLPAFVENYISLIND